MRLPDDVRERFRRFGAKGGRTRAAHLSPEARSAVARRAGAVRWIRKRFGVSNFEEAGYPGGAMVDRGIAGLADGRVSVESLLVSLAAARLRREGVPLRRVQENAEDGLFELLSRTAGDLAHARYIAHLRQMSSFADACRNERLKRARRAS